MFKIRRKKDMTDYTIYKFRETLIKEINEAQLPPTVIGYVLKELLGEINQIANQNIQQGVAENNPPPVVDAEGEIEDGRNSEN